MPGLPYICENPQATRITNAKNPAIKNQVFWMFLSLCVYKEAILKSTHHNIKFAKNQTQKWRGELYFFFFRGVAGYWLKTDFHRLFRRLLFQFKEFALGKAEGVGNEVIGKTFN